MTTAAQWRLSLSDVARLARVQRPVVTMWRTRAARSALPFPDPVSSEGGRVWFDASDVGAWLTATGRGNNPNAEEDLASFASVPELTFRDDRAAFEAVTSLLCLHVVSGRRMADLDRDELLDLADECDPDDRLLYSELSAAGDRLETIASFTDSLLDAAMGAPAAFEQLMADRFRSQLPEHSSSAVTAPALALIAKIAVGLAQRGGPEPTYVDPTGGSSDVVLATVREQSDRGPFRLLTTAPDVPAARLARRRLRVHDVYREDLAASSIGAFTAPRGATHLAQYPWPGEPAMTDLQIVTAVENAVVQMDDSQRGLVIGPAGALCGDRTDRAAAAVRADILRAGHVRAIVRLPRGLAPARSRQALALWVLGPSHHEDEPAERRTMVADLAGAALSVDMVDNLVSDVTAATGGREFVRAHAFAFLRAVPTRSLLAARRSLVHLAPIAGPSGSIDTAAHLVRIARLRERVVQPVDGVTSLPTLAAESAGGRVVRPMTLDSALAAGHLHASAGNRIDPADVGATSGVRVVGVPELLGDVPSGGRAIDRLRLAARYDAARLTEPGDVVFCTGPRPAALVDRDGGAVVAYPARVLRIDRADPGGLLPEVVAADINRAPRAAGTWRQWPVRAVGDEQRTALAGTLAELRDGAARLRARLGELDELTEALIQAAATGALTVHSDANPPKGH